MSTNEPRNPDQVHDEEVAGGGEPVAFEPWDGSDNEQKPAFTKSKRRLTITLFLVAFGMLGFAFANVPLFQIVCEKLGIAQFDGSRMTPAEAIEDGELGREIRVAWSGSSVGRLPLTVRPAQPIQTTNLNKMTVNDYVFTNTSNRTVFFKPIHTIQPSKASSEDMFILSECFCFEPQMIRPRETVRLPVVFRLSPDMPNDVAQIIVNYSLFEMTENDFLRETGKTEVPG